MHFVEIIYHPAFTDWLAALVATNVEVGGEVQALIDALEKFGVELGDPESGHIAGSGLSLRALRRSPPSAAAPYAEGAPFIRVLYGFVVKGDSTVSAVLLLGGDKTVSGNAWYSRSIPEAERRLEILASSNGWRAVARRQSF